MQQTDPGRSRRVRRRLAVGGGLMALALLGGVFATTIASAAPSPDDPRAEIHPGTVSTCAQVGFSGDQILGSGGMPQASGTVTQTPDGKIVVTISDRTGGGQELNIAFDPSSGLVIDTIIVKGGDNYNQYPGTVLDHLIAPFVGNGNVGMISHWFLCYRQGTTTTTDPSGSSTGTSTSGTSTAGAAGTVTAAPRFTG